MAESPKRVWRRPGGMFPEAFYFTEKKPSGVTDAEAYIREDLVADVTAQRDKMREVLDEIPQPHGGQCEMSVALWWRIVSALVASRDEDEKK